MKAVKTVMSDHFLLMTNLYTNIPPKEIEEEIDYQIHKLDEEEDYPLENTLPEYFTEARRQTGALRMVTVDIDDEIEKWERIVECIKEGLEYQNILQKKFKKYQKALIEKMNEIKKFFDETQPELKLLLDDLQEIINNG